MLSLGIDTSNYATSLAVVDSTSGEVVCALKKILPVKKGELGLRQSDAVFHHTKVLPELLEQLVNETELKNVESVGISEKPRPIDGSYMPCFLAGVSFGHAFSAAKGIKPVLTTHQQGHVQAARFGTGNRSLLSGKALVFHFSGGTSELLLTDGYQIKATLGKSMDLFAGQAIDRLGVQLGYEFPAGVYVSQLAEACDDKIKVKISVKNMDCHFSGLQNQYTELINAGYPNEYIAKYVLYAVADTALLMAKNALKLYPGLPVICAGGVMTSNVIKQRMLSKLDNLFFVPPVYSSDNAIGVALIAQKESEY